MTKDLFAGIPVRDYRTALARYERLLGAPPSFLPNDIEAYGNGARPMATASARQRFATRTATKWDSAALQSDRNALLGAIASVWMCWSRSDSR
jgi:hypothetical protein